MGEILKPERPTGLMRVTLGLVLAALAGTTALPIILVVALLFAAGLTCGAAVSLEHSGALDDPEAFRLAHWVALVPLGLFFAIAYGRLLMRSRAKEEVAFPLRWPALTACGVLPLLALVVLSAAWDTKVVAPVAGAVVLANLWFFTLASLLAMLYVAGGAVWLVYSWAATTKFRTGLTTGLLLTPLAVTLSYGVLSGPTTAPTDAPERASWTQRAPAAAVIRRPAVSALEGERTALHELAQALDPTHGPASAVAATESRSTSPAAPPAAAAPLAPAHAPGVDLPSAPAAQAADNLVAACMHELATASPGEKSQFDQVKDHMQSKYGFWYGDAHDIVADALFSVCEAHARKPYQRLGAVLQTAGDRRAAKWRRRSRRSCPIEGEFPSCARSADETVRFEREDEVLNAALCKEDEITQDILYMRAIEGKQFGEIALVVGLAEDATRSKFNNARGRLRKRLAESCGP